jgi:hypothetical protein
MRKIISLVLVGALSLAPPVYAGGHSHGRGFHHHGFHHGCCVGRAFFVSGVFVGALAPWYYPPYPYPFPYPVYVQPQEYIQAPPRDVCYEGGCYHLNGDGVTVAYQWVWIPNAPSGPPPPPPQSSPPQQ